jgi:hypothetical protein
MDVMVTIASPEVDVGRTLPYGMEVNVRNLDFTFVRSA